ncbi:hypothetical protein G6L55_18140 [Agrobacterium tumefaciens]|nr:hypothetical protein [Agrobacterium tumefaciens]NTE52085.1 hypothetical protein [Agrobacterium tumefaciens]
MAKDRKLSNSRRWSYVLKPLVTERRNVLLAQANHRPVGEIMAAQNVDALYLLDDPAFQGRHFSLISFEQLPERGAFEYFCVRCSSAPINLCFEVACPLFGFEFGDEALAAGLHTAPSHLCLAAPSEFPIVATVISNIHCRSRVPSRLELTAKPLHS